ncbi:unnamed protein product [Mytilus edulis]|uniref:Cilia- and flagella-associated protein 157 n=2 Tax=Mytilus edulis TaxID=6550 RepID=A0A8S3U3F0_MYTED|nr:unnamed protein product [Mytilus edulis]
MLTEKCFNQENLIGELESVQTQNQHLSAELDLTSQQVESQRDEIQEMAKENELLEEDVKKVKDDHLTEQKNKFKLEKLINDVATALKIALRKTSPDEEPEGDGELNEIERRDNMLENLLILLNSAAAIGVGPQLGELGKQYKIRQRSASKMPGSEGGIKRGQLPMSPVALHPGGTLPHYQLGDLGLIPRPKQHIPTSFEQMRVLSATTRLGNLKKVLTRSVAIQTVSAPKALFYADQLLARVPAATQNAMLHEGSIERITPPVVAPLGPIRTSSKMTIKSTPQVTHIYFTDSQLYTTVKSTPQVIHIYFTDSQNYITVNSYIYLSDNLTYTTDGQTYPTGDSCVMCTIQTVKHTQQVIHVYDTDSQTYPTDSQKYQTGNAGLHYRQSNIPNRDSWLRYRQSDIPKMQCSSKLQTIKNNVSMLQTGNATGNAGLRYKQSKIPNSSTLQTAEHIQKAFHVYVTDIQTDPTCNSCHHYKQSNIPNRYCIFTLQKVKHTHCNWQFMTTLQSQTNPSGNACLHYRQSNIPNRQFMSTIYSHSPTYPSGNSCQRYIHTVQHTHQVIHIV